MKKETSIKLHLYIKQEISEEEAYDAVADMVSDYEEIYGEEVEYQIHEIEVQE